MDVQLLARRAAIGLRGDSTIRSPSWQLSRCIGLIVILPVSSGLRLNVDSNNHMICSTSQYQSNICLQGMQTLSVLGGRKMFLACVQSTNRASNHESPRKANFYDMLSRPRQ